MSQPAAKCALVCCRTVHLGPLVQQGVWHKTGCIAHLQAANFCGFLSKTELQAAAQPHCDASFTTVSAITAGVQAP